MKLPTLHAPEHSSASDQQPLLADLGGVLDFTGELGRLAIAQVGRGGEGVTRQPAS